MGRSLVFAATNHHVAACGRPPRVRSASDTYTGYFENGFGEQAVFTFDRAAHRGELRLGDAGWGEAFAVVDGTVPGLVLDAGEQLWLAAAWAEATGSLPAWLAPVRAVIELPQWAGLETARRVARTDDGNDLHAHAFLATFRAVLAEAGPEGVSDAQGVADPQDVSEHNDRAPRGADI